MKKELVLIFLILSVSVCAGSYYDAEELTLDTTISNTLDVVPEQSNYVLKSVQAYLSYYPKKDFRQEVSNLKTQPEGKLSEDMYVFNWKEPTKEELTFSVSGQVTTYNRINEIKNKVAFPITSLPDETKIYLKETSTIDYEDRRIMNLAQELASGEDDLYVVVHKFADWVNNNIEYNLNTKTAQASQKASWVIENRYGVCDELTNLFMGLCRAVGIPVKFVSGVSYTDLDIFPDKWSPHGWAEVYFPGVGWVPFDVTYGEFGYIDPTHVKLNVAADANRTSSRYEWVGYHVRLDTNQIDLNTKVKDVRGIRKPLITLSSDVLKDKVGFGSYDALVATLTNPHEYYVPTEITLVGSEGVQVFDKTNKHVLLKPRETKKIFWVFKLDDTLLKNYIYNFTMKTYSVRNASGLIHLMSSEEYKKYSLNEITAIIDGMTEEEEKTYSKNLAIACTADSVYYVGEKATIKCVLENTGNVALNGLSVCLVDDCMKTNLGISQKTEVGFHKKLTEEGPMDFVITAKNDEVTKSTNVAFESWGRPGIYVSELSFPKTISLDENFKISFKVGPNSSSIPKNVKISLVSNSFTKEWTPDMLSAHKFVLNVNDYTLNQEVNKFKLILLYSDELGRTYSDSHEFEIRLKNISFLQRLFLLTGKINMRDDFLIIGLSLLISIVIIRFLFRVKHNVKSS